MSSDLPPGWSVSSVGQLFQLGKKGCNPSKNPRDRFLHYSIPAFDETGGPIIEMGQAIESNKFLLTEPCILVSKLNPRKSRVIVFRPGEDGMQVCASTEFIIYISNDDEETSIDYFARYMASEPFRQQLERIAIGTTNSHVRARPPLTLKWEVPVPPPLEQQAIARILDAVDAAIERTRTVIATAEKLKRGLMQQALKRCSKAKSPVERLDKLAEIGSGVTLGKDLTGSATVDLPYLRVANVQDGFLDLKEIKTVKIKPTEIEKYQLAEGDVLLTEGGDIDKLGRGAVWAGEIAPCLHQNHIFRVRADRTKLDPHFLATLISSEYGKRFFLRIAKRTTNLASINKTQLSSFPVIVPKLGEQKAIVNLLAGVDHSIKTHERAHRDLEKLKRGLMQNLLTGRVRVKLPASSGNGVARSRT